MIARYVGMVLKMQAVFMLVPMLFSVFDQEYRVARGFLATTVLCIVAFILLDLVKYDVQKTVYIKDGFVAVAICWIVISFVGAFPYWIGGEIPFFLDALFESTSGFTTTGATILAAVEDMPRGLLFWRSFSQWIGGMGVLVFLLAIVPAISGGERTLSVMKAESPGPAPGKLVPKLRQSSKILYIIYIVLTLLQIIFLLAGGMPAFDSVVNALSTAGTGGFSVRNASVAAYNSAYIEGVFTAFMILFGINFNVFYFLLIKNFSAAYKSEELRAYLGIIAVSVLMITANITGAVYQSLSQSFRHASFSVASIISSTGFAITDYNLWPTFSKSVLLILMFIGACAGSTGCGIKVSRVIMLVREVKRILFRMVHPRSVEVVKLDGKAVDKVVVHAVNAFFVTFMMLFGASFLLVSLDGFDFETTFTAVLAALNNMGLGFGKIGSGGSFSDFSVLSKLVLSFDMLIGRLEIYPILLLISPRTWRKI